MWHRIGSTLAWLTVLVGLWLVVRGHIALGIFIIWIVLFGYLSNN